MKVKEIVVNSNNDCLIWQVPTEGVNFAKTVTLKVGTGCEAICYINGSFKRFYSGSYELEWKKETKKGNTITVIGVNRDKSFKLRFGVGGVPFNDKEVKLNTVVGIHGECDCTLSDGDAIYKAFGDGKKEVKPEDIDAKFKLKFAESLVSEFAKKLEEYNYFTIYQSVSELSEIVKKQFAKDLAFSGIILNSCSVNAPYFKEGYTEERSAKLEGKEKEKRDDMKHLQELNLLRDLNKNSAPATPVAPVAPDAPKNTEPRKLFCTHCGKENAAGSKFCRFCGTALN